MGLRAINAGDFHLAWRDAAVGGLSQKRAHLVEPIHKLAGDTFREGVESENSNVA